MQGKVTTYITMYERTLWYVLKILLILNICQKNKTHSSSERRRKIEKRPRRTSVCLSLRTAVDIAHLIFFEPIGKVFKVQSLFLMFLLVANPSSSKVPRIVSDIISRPFKSVCWLELDAKSQAG